MAFESIEQQITNWLVEMDGYNPDTSSVQTKYFSSSTIAPMKPTDTTRANIHYKARVKDPGNFELYMFESGRTSGIGRGVSGQVTLNNADGVLDELLDWGFDGREIRIYRGYGNDFADYTLWFKGTMDLVEFLYSKTDKDSARISASELSIKVRNKLSILDLPLQDDRYLGTNVSAGGIEGTEDDIKGQVKPIGYGEIYEAIPILVNAPQLVYQVHDSAIEQIVGVRDKGVPLTKDTALGTSGNFTTSAGLLAAVGIAAGKYITCLSEGMIRLQAQPEGDVTINFKGDNLPSAYADIAADIIEKLLIERCSVSAGELNAASFTQLATDVTYKMGIYVSQDRNRRDAIGELLESFGGFLIQNRIGQYVVGRLLTPTGTPVLTIKERSIVEIEKRNTEDSDKGLPVYRVNLNYKKNYFPRTAGELKTSDINVDAEYVSFSEREYRTVTTEDTSIKTKHLLSPELDRSALLVSEANANTEAARLLTLYKTRRDRFLVTIEEPETIVNLNDVIKIEWNRFEIGGGKLFRVLGIIFKPTERKITLDLWG